MKYLYCIIIFILPFYCYSQNISGTITDQFHKPIEYATITLKKDSVIIKSTISDFDGKYNIKDVSINNRYTLVFSFVGYRTKDTTLLLLKNTNMSIELTTQGNQLKEVSINDRKKLIERKIDRLVFNVDNRINGLGSDALDVLSKTPLVRVENDAISLIGKNAVGINLR